MSTWHEISDEDIEIDNKTDTVILHIGDDEWGNKYCTLTRDQIIKLYECIKPA